MPPVDPGTREDIELSITIAPLSPNLLDPLSIEMFPPPSDPFPDKIETKPPVVSLRPASM
jgi:hypothetical protein